MSLSDAAGGEFPVKVSSPNIIHYIVFGRAYELEVAFAKDGTLPDPESSTNLELKCILPLPTVSLSLDTNKRTRLANHGNCVREETATVVSC